MKPANAKRIYHFKSFFNDMGFLAPRLFAVIDAYRSARIPWSFAEKIMLATTAVNDCVHCARVHTRLAKASGVSEQEVIELLHSDIERTVDAYEYRALCFAQHYAETDRRPEPESIKALVDYYGEKKANDIMLYIRLIFVGNLTGNTFDAFRTRLRGRRHPDSSLSFELFLLLVAVPIIALIGAPLVLVMATLSRLVPALSNLTPQRHLQWDQ